MMEWKSMNEMPIESTLSLDGYETFSDHENVPSTNNYNDDAAKERSREHSSKLDIAALKGMLNDTDVLLGGGGGLSNHVKGTKYYRQQLNQCRSMFQEGDPSEQSCLVQSILESVWANDGRFLIYNEETSVVSVAANGVAHQRVHRDLLRQPVRGKRNKRTPKSKVARARGSAKTGNQEEATKKTQDLPAAKTGYSKPHRRGRRR
jgi:hypothetical protein